MRCTLRDLIFLSIIAGPIVWAVPYIFGSQLPQTLSVIPFIKLNVWVLFVYPVLEEIVFRGWIQGSLKRKWRFVWNPPICSTANLVTSILFATLHIFSRSPTVGLMVFLPSLLLGMMRDAKMPLVGLILIHIYWNTGVLIFW